MNKLYGGGLQIQNGVMYPEVNTQHTDMDA